jgi:hypothetical protein
MYEIKNLKYTYQFTLTLFSIMGRKGRGPVRYLACRHILYIFNGTGLLRMAAAQGN